MHNVLGTFVVGRAREADIRIQDDGISRLHARVEMGPDEAVIEDLGSTNGSFVNGQRIERCELHDGDKIQFGGATILKFTFQDEIEEAFQRRMFESASRDGLTGLYNRRFLLARLQSEFAFAARHETPLSLIIFDIDHFKNVNDTFGHLAGDHVLVAVGQLVTPMIRAEDVFGRFGGEEFVIISRSAAPPFPDTVAERVRASVERCDFAHDGKVIHVTLSLGIARMPHPETKALGDLLGRADRAMYEAKAAGRNCVAQAD
jgi:diguanylate cyclase (GGDEF)-like protein